jgi:hypothetical protein
VRWRPSHRDFDTCLLVDGTTHLYLMIEGGGDCPAGCTEMTYRGFETAAAGQVTFLGSSVQGQDGFAGITSDRDISACTKWLSPRWDRFVAGPGSAGRNPDPLPAAADTRLTVVQFEATPPLPRMELERQRFTDHAREIAKCRAARTTGPPHGDVHVTLVVDAKSRTTTVTSLDSPWQEQLVHDCLASVLHRWVPEDVEERTTVTSTSRFGIPEGAR